MPVLYEIVKRRFVRVPLSEFGLEGSITLCNWLGIDGFGSSRETLNLPHMIGLPNRAIEQISRSWSFCCQSRSGALLRVGIGNVNNQVS
jgi:hypothetical protein